VQVVAAAFGNSIPQIVDLSHDKMVADLDLAQNLGSLHD
jgi:hypothetical protein